MNRVEYPYTTISSGISVFDRDNQYRPLQWTDASNEIDWLQREDNGLLLSILEHLPSLEQEHTNPIVNWTEDERLETYSPLATAMTASSTTLNMDDNYIVVAGSFVTSPSDGEIMRIDTVNYSTGHTVTRGMNGTAGVAKSVDDVIIAMPAYMSELDDPKDGVGRLPGTAQYNFISLASKTFKVGVMQNNSMVFDNWGQVPKAAIDTILDMRRELSYGLLFQARATYATASAGQMYIGQGALHYNKDGFLDLGTMSNNLTWPILNDYLEGRFQPDASSNEKTLIAGQTLYSSALTMMRSIGRLDTEPYFEPTLKVWTFDIRTDGGYVVHVLLDKFGLAINAGLGTWGFLFDMAWISGAHFKGLGFQWFQNIQANRSILLREDTYMGSFALLMKHQTCHGVIRGGAGRIVTR